MLRLQLELELANHWGSIRIGSQHTHSQKLQYHTVCLDVMACHSDLLLSSLLAQAFVSLIIVDKSSVITHADCYLVISHPERTSLLPDYLGLPKYSFFDISLLKQIVSRAFLHLRPLNLRVHRRSWSCD
jgi:hypothetical protein